MTVASLIVRVGGDLSDLKRTMSRVDRAVQPAREALQSLQTKALAVTASLGAMAGLSVAAWDKQAKAVAAVENGIRSTGGAARKSLEDLKEQASSLQETSLFGDEEILQGVTAQLLTFTNIAGREFDRTQQAAVDLSAKLGTDLKSSAIQLGKALNDPVANLSALSRSGIQFSADQKAVIGSLVESGRLAEAQSIILGELERQYGGTAQAAATAGAGGLKQLSNSMGDLTEEIGAVVYDYLRPLIAKVRESVTWFQGLDDQTKKNIVRVGLLVAAIGPLLAVLTTVLAILPQMVAGFKLASVAIAALGISAKAALISTGIGAAVVALGAAAWYLYDNWEVVSQKLKVAWAGLKLAAFGFANGVARALNLIPGIEKVLPGVGATYEALSGKVRQAHAEFERAKTLSKVTEVMVYARKQAQKTGEGFDALKDAVTDASAGVDDALTGVGTSAERATAKLSETVTAMKEVLGLGRGLQQLELPSGLSESKRKDHLGKEHTDVRYTGPLAGSGATEEQIEAAHAWSAALEEPLSMVERLRRTWLDLRVVIEEGAGEALRGVVDYAARGIGEMVAGMRSFKDAVKGMGQVLRQMVAQLVAAVAQALILKAIMLAVGGPSSGVGSFLASAFGGARASGGPVSFGKTYLVGERGPELFTPGGSGTIIPNHKLQSASAGMREAGARLTERGPQRLEIRPGEFRMENGAILASVRAALKDEKRAGLSTGTL